MEVQKKIRNKKQKVPFETYILTSGYFTNRPLACEDSADLTTLSDGTGVAFYNKTMQDYGEALCRYVNVVILFYFRY
jgi:hypothetical protein